MFVVFKKIKLVVVSPIFVPMKLRRTVANIIFPWKASDYLKSMEK
jgi:hypothetical protein